MPLGGVAEIWGAEPKSCCVKVVRLKGEYVRSLASRSPSRRGPSSRKHPNIRTSHPLAPALECSDVRLVGQEARERVLELRCPVAVPREIGSLSRMNDDGTNIIVSQQRRDLVFGDWASAAIFLPRRVWIGEELLHRLLRCYFRAADIKSVGVLDFVSEL